MDIASNDKCTGCGSCQYACKRNAIVMREDKDGFMLPSINKDMCVECGVCSKSCPIVNVQYNHTFSQLVYAARNKDSCVINGSSSGGIFYVLAKHVILNGGVVYGAAWNSKMQVTHIRISDINDINILMKSKYIQSDIYSSFDSINNDLKNGMTVLFSGTPCQVAAINKQFSSYGDKLLLIDVVCHGVPSYRLFREYITYFEYKNKDKVKHYSFREKNKYLGSYVTLVIGERKRYIRTWKDLSYSYLFMNSYISRESCYQCMYACKDRVGDITLGDYWGVNKYHHRFNTDEGASMIMINSAKGKELFNSISDEIIYELSSYEYASQNNHQIVTSSKRPKERDDIFRGWNLDGYESLYRFYKSRVKHSWKDIFKRIFILIFRERKNGVK